MKQILSLLLLLPSALNAGPVLSVVATYPSEVQIEATAQFYRQYNPSRPPEQRAYTSYLYLEKSFFSLQQRTSNYLASVSSSNNFTTALALLNVRRNGIYLTCTVQNTHDVSSKETWPVTIPYDKNFEKTIELDLLDDAREKIKVTIKSTIKE